MFLGDSREYNKTTARKKKIYIGRHRHTYTHRNTERGGQRDREGAREGGGEEEREMERERQRRHGKVIKYSLY